MLRGRFGISAPRNCCESSLLTEFLAMKQRSPSGFIDHSSARFRNFWRCLGRSDLLPFEPLRDAFEQRNDPVKAVVQQLPLPILFGVFDALVQTQLGQGIAAGDAYNFVRHLAGLGVTAMWGSARF